MLLRLGTWAAVPRTRRAVSVVAAAAIMAVLALAAIAINDANERTELVYRSSLDTELNPAAGSGKVRGGWMERTVECWATSCSGWPRADMAACAWQVDSRCSACPITGWVGDG